MSVLLPNPLTVVSGSLVAAGGAALVGALYWWLHDLKNPAEASAAMSLTKRMMNPWRWALVM